MLAVCVSVCECVCVCVSVCVCVRVGRWHFIFTVFQPQSTSASRKSSLASDASLPTPRAKYGPLRGPIDAPDDGTGGPRQVHPHLAMTMPDVSVAVSDAPDNSMLSYIERRRLGSTIERGSSVGAPVVAAAAAAAAPSTTTTTQAVRDASSRRARVSMWGTARVAETCAMFPSDDEEYRSTMLLHPRESPARVLAASTAAAAAAAAEGRAPRTAVPSSRLPMVRASALARAAALEIAGPSPSQITPFLTHRYRRWPRRATRLFDPADTKVGKVLGAA
jgi:hypothetical protein